MIDKFYFIGFGAVAHALIETFNLDNNKYINIPLVIIEPRDILHPQLLEDRGFVHIKKAITNNNFKTLLKDIDEKTLVIDLSVEVDSIMVLKFCKDKGAYYINTSVENWEEFHDPTRSNKLSNNYDDFKHNTLYHRELMVDNLLKNTKKTRVVNMGFNPGAINEYAKLGLKKYGKLKNKKLINGNYAKLAFDLGLKSVHIVEYDSQKSNIKKKDKDTFYNSWSSKGFQSESADYVMMSVSNEDEIKYNNLIEPTDGLKNTHIRFLPIRGMDLMDESITLDDKGKPFKYEGYLIPHAEIFSMSRFFEYNGNAPTIYYIYRPCDIAIDSLKKFKKNNYIPLKNDYVLQLDDIIDGFDSIGALLTFEDGHKYWAGSVCNVDNVKKLGYKFATPTTVQVAGSLYATIQFIFSHPNFGFNEPETLPSEFLFNHFKKYMGKSYFKLI